MRKFRMPVPSDRASIAAALLLVAAAYLIINYTVIVESVLYRVAAHDTVSAMTSAAVLAAQAAILLAGVALMQGVLRWLLLGLVAGSALVNKGYSTIVGGTLDVQKIDWMLAETRQAGNAAGQFAWPFGVSVFQVALAILLLAAAARLLTHIGKKRRKWITALVAMLVFAPSLVLPWTGLWPLGAERNLYSFAAAIIAREPPPRRRTVTVSPNEGSGIKKIVWLVDESVAYEPYRQTLARGLERFDPIDFGEVAAMGHCSTPSNVALRSGVDVRNASAILDLRTMPTIWAYARRAGYRTTMIDGQTSGAPQNMLEGAELALVDRYLSMSAGVDTDRGIAKFLNRELRDNGKQFIYVVLKGVHFQYSDHVPPHLRDPKWSIEEEYRAALAYSKKQFFDLLLSGVDREQAIVIYTSDHGQNLTPGVLPHCSRDPVRAEFSVPLIAFLPPLIEPQWTARTSRHSVSQIFPTTLQWMGYPADYTTKHYDNDLHSPTARYVWFGRNVVPGNEGDRIEISASENFPGN